MARAVWPTGQARGEHRIRRSPGVRCCGARPEASVGSAIRPDQRPRPDDGRAQRPVGHRARNARSRRQPAGARNPRFPAARRAPSLPGSGQRTGTVVRGGHPLGGRAPTRHRRVPVARSSSLARREPAGRMTRRRMAFLAMRRTGRPARPGGSPAVPSLRQFAPTLLHCGESRPWLECATFAVPTGCEAPGSMSTSLNGVSDERCGRR